MPPPPPTFELDQPLYYFTGRDQAREPFTIRQACEGVQIFGGIGSGKTSGSGAHLARSFLRAGFGGLVLTAKTDVLKEWERYAGQTGRKDSLIVLDASGGLRFNFLQYEAQRGGEGGGFTANILRLFLTVYEVLERGGTGSGSDPYWNNAMKQLMRNAIDLSLIVTGKVTMQGLYDIVMSAPKSLSEPTERPDFWKDGECGRLLYAGNTADLSETQKRDFSTTAKYWLKDFASLGDRQRAGIVSMFTSMVDNFIRSPFAELFGSDNFPDEHAGYQTAWPEVTFTSHDGAPPHVLVLNLPVKEFGDAGRAAQVVYKYMWQQAIERRRTGDHSIPAFLWVDEAQNFVSDYDMQFQATARSSRACTVYLTQNLPNYYAEMGGEQSKPRVDSLVGNLQTKIWHANSDPQTNQHAAEVIGESWQIKESRSLGTAGTTASTNVSQSQQFAYDVPPQTFTTLAKGGPDNGFTVEGIVFQNGRRWRHGSTALLAQFDQRG